MFNLPTFTWVSITGVIGFWVVYTLAFLWVSRTWTRDDVDVAAGVGAAAGGLEASETPADAEARDDH